MLSQFILISELPLYVKNENCYFYGNKFDLTWLDLNLTWIDPSHKSHNASDEYPMMHHFVTEMCIHMHISATKWCIVGYGTDALWDLWYGSIEHLEPGCLYIPAALALWNSSKRSWKWTWGVHFSMLTQRGLFEAYGVVVLGQYWLTHWGRDKMAVISQTTF